MTLMLDPETEEQYRQYCLASIVGVSRRIQDGRCTLRDADSRQAESAKLRAEARQIAGYGVEMPQLLAFADALEVDDRRTVGRMIVDAARARCRYEIHDAKTHRNEVCARARKIARGAA